MKNSYWVSFALNQDAYYNAIYEESTGTDLWFDETNMNSFIDNSDKKLSLSKWNKENRCHVVKEITKEDFLILKEKGWEKLHLYFPEQFI